MFKSRNGCNNDDDNRSGGGGDDDIKLSVLHCFIQTVYCRKNMVNTTHVLGEMIPGILPTVVKLFITFYFKI
jgi:hypothetical protein